MIVGGHLRRAALGFTLIEVLVALTIVGVALGAAMRAMSSMTQASHDLGERMVANWSAENHLSTLRLAKGWPSPGTRHIPCPQGGRALVCTETTSATPNPAFRRIEVAVYASENPSARLAWLVTLQPDPNRSLF
jgi:general secretion pathway protein I